jgi:hypothetical protein
MARCDRCGEVYPVLELWRRVYPDPRRASVCTSCGDAWRKQADDRGSDGQDNQRLATLVAGVGGEYWRAGEDLFYFRHPVWHAPEPSPRARRTPTRRRAKAPSRAKKRRSRSARRR